VKAFTAPQGRNKKAQGNALGENDQPKVQSKIVQQKP